MRRFAAIAALVFGLQLPAAEFATRFPWPRADELANARGSDHSVRIHYTPHFIAIRWQDHTSPATLDRVLNLMMPQWQEARPELIRLHRKMLDLGSNMKFRRGETVAQLGYRRTPFTVVWPGTPAERNTLVFENIRRTQTFLTYDE
jgi:hypothetical protein